VHDGNNYRFLQKSNGIWRQLFESEIQQNIQNRTNRKNGVREVIIEDPDTKSKENKHWNVIEEEMLFHWYSKKGINISQLNADDFSSVAEQICWTWSACKSKLRHIQRDGLASNEKSGLITKWSKEISDPNANIPAEFWLKELCNVEGIITSFSLNLIKKRSAIHITQIAPNKLALFDKFVYMETKGGNVDDDDRQYIDKLHLQKCIMPDDIARKLHNFDEETGGAENPHILHLKSREFRGFLHGDCFI
jgi:hypothetical protein